ncbi:MAG TPA: iron-containing alcohol dehydrogenase [Flavisolibacter sp.]|jgi:alcohol dehydrogenase class IV|nr:iron-containing alcohol dehydrogenase [Flavisolibacter sp.]
MQQVIKGTGCLQMLPKILQQRAAGSLLFVTGHHLLQEDEFQDLLQTIDLPYQLVQPPAGVLQVDAIPAYSELDTVVAIGGGKVMDFAKGILYRHQARATLIAAPTTAGSGSEATPIAVFYQGMEKVSLDAANLLPAIAFLDAALLTNLPPLQKAISGADALAQCIESVWNVHSTNFSETFALEGMTLLWEHLPAFVETAAGAAAEKTMWAAYLSGKAIAHTRTTGPHALAYYLTANYDVPHGQAVALTLPVFFLYNEGDASQDQLQKIYSVLQVQNAEEAFFCCRQFFKSLGLATTLTELGLENLDIDLWLQSVNQQRFSNNPVPFDAFRLKELFRRYLR